MEGSAEEIFGKKRDMIGVRGTNMETKRQIEVTILDSIPSPGI
jgi:hypothetical protein